MGEEVMDSAENVGILQFILKMAVAQAGQECKSHVQDHEDWLAVTADRLGPMLQSQANAAISKQALIDARAALNEHHCTASQKSKKFLMGFAGASETALKATMFATWFDIVQTTKKEMEIRKEYADEIDLAEKRLTDYILQQTNIMKNMINRKHLEGEGGLLGAVFQAFVDE